MQLPSFFVQKKNVILEALALVVFLGGGYYLYTVFSEDTTIIAQTQINEQLLGQNFVLFLKVVNQDKISFRDVTFMDSELVQQLRDYSETISINETRGRSDPFVPYAPTGSLR